MYEPMPGLVAFPLIAVCAGVAVLVWPILTGFVIFTVFSAIFALLFTIDIIIGETLYLFKKDEVEVHVHAMAPVFPGFKAGLPVDPEFKAETVFQIRVGGWFRKNVILGKHHFANWQISHCWTGKDLRLRDYRGNEVHASASTLLKLVQTFLDVKSTVSEYETAKHSLAELKEGRSSLERRRDQLFLGCVALTQIIRKTHETLGRSRHAQFLRECLEELLNAEPAATTEDLEDRWRKKLAHLARKPIKAGPAAPSGGAPTSAQKSGTTT